MKFLTVIIDLPQSAYVVQTDPPAADRFVIRLAAIIAAIVVFDLLTGLQKTLQETMQKTLQETMQKTLQAIVYSVLPAFGGVI